MNDTKPEFKPTQTTDDGNLPLVPSDNFKSGQKKPGPSDQVDATKDKEAMQLKKKEYENE